VHIPHLSSSPNRKSKIGNRKCTRLWHGFVHDLVTTWNCKMLGFNDNVTTSRLGPPLAGGELSHSNFRVRISFGLRHSSFCPDTLMFTLRTHLRRRNPLISLVCHTCHGLKPLPAGKERLPIVLVIVVVVVLDPRNSGLLCASEISVVKTFLCSLCVIFALFTLNTLAITGGTRTKPPSILALSHLHT
jgi:hypothetical protein